MASLVLTGDTSGQVTIAAPAVAGTTTLTLPATTGTVALTSDVIGLSQTWQSFTVGTTRVSGTTYTNTTGKPIQVLINGSGVSGSFFVSGIKVGTWSTLAETAQSAIVPAGSTYVATAASLLQWSELR
jgi:hypothetical protein